VEPADRVARLELLDRLDRYEPGHRRAAVHHGDRVAAADGPQVRGETSLELGDADLLHDQMMTSCDHDVNEPSTLGLGIQESGQFAVERLT
jgi:hypothetical protein